MLYYHYGHMLKVPVFEGLYLINMGLVQALCLVMIYCVEVVGTRICNFTIREMVSLSKINAFIFEEISKDSMTAF